MTLSKTTTALEGIIAASKAGARTARPLHVPNVVPEARMEWLGEHAGQRYGVWNNTEYAVDTRTDADHHGAREGQIIVRSRETDEVDGSAIEFDRSFRGIPVPSGTYARLVAAADEKRARLAVERAPKPIDVLARLPLLRATPDSILAIARAFGRTLLEPGIISPGETVPLPRVPADRSVLMPGRRPARGPAAILDRLAAKGIGLSVTRGGRLLVTSPGGRVDDDVLEVTRGAERLIVGHLTGVPVVCELQHDGTPPEAVTIVAVGVASCGEHS